MSKIYANRMDYMKASEIREMLKTSENPEIISFAGGSPAPELFPIEELSQISEQVIRENGRQALQYGTTEGFQPLREQVAARMNDKLKTNFVAENILITNGSQQGLDFSGKVFINEGDVILCESPTYLAALNAFRAYMPRFVEVPTDKGGMIMDELEQILSTEENIKLIYIIPDFQNPSGTSWSYDRKKEFMKIVKAYDVIVIEDSPYHELRFDGEKSPSVKSLDDKGQVVCLGTFSKILCPGLRIGWIAASTEIIERYILIKQSSDLHTASFNQRIISRYMELYDLDENVNRIKSVYKRRRDIMIKGIETEFPEGIKFTRPEGGLFLWVELKDSMNARKVLIKSLENMVVFVPGGAFFPNSCKENTFRLNYSNMPEERIIEGIKILGKVLREI
jgi:2-aminoadipate transaminase